ncbi:MAG: twin-arginine translocase TatA/TatE family subunit [Ignavibacteria bacterium]|nr:twin-arginine translocase TatA/TatE family subunit [Ignavibacteria bacterium]
MFSNLGFGEIALVALLALLLFGPQKLPELLQHLGKGIREFNKAMKDMENEIKDSLDSEIKRPSDTTTNKDQTKN